MSPTKPRSKALRICHFSDLHLPLRSEVSPVDLANKRALGWLNLKLNRGKTHRLEILEGLLDGIAKEGADLHVVTGDFTSLALPDELREIRALIERFGITPDNAIVVPGNHDRYTITADVTSVFERAFAEYTGFARGDRSYPIFRPVGPAVVVAVDTAVWRGPVRAAGRLEANQISRLVAGLDAEDASGLWPVVAMHHPPFLLDGEALRQYRVGLEGHERLSTALAGRSGTFLHGHLHIVSRRRLGGFEAFGVPSASNGVNDPTRQAAYGVYAFDRAGLVDARLVRYCPGPDGGRFENTPFPAVSPNQGVSP